RQSAGAAVAELSRSASEGIADGQVPSGAGSGKARITLSYPGLVDWNVLPATLEVPVEGPRLWGWLWHYGPWGLGAVLVAGMAWFVVRRQARLGRTRRCT